MAKQINVLAFGGLGGSVYSAGLRVCLMKLQDYRGKDKPIDYMTFEDYKTWRSWADNIKSWRDDTAAVVHSYGAAAVFGMVRALGATGPKIPLVIVLDASQYTWMSFALWGSGGNVVPERVERVINFYTTSGLIGGQKLYRADGSMRGITNLAKPGISHAAIDDDPKVQFEVVEAIKQLF